MILYVTNVDTDLLALRQILEDLPEELGRVRAARCSSAGIPDLDGVRVAVVRLLGGVRGWERLDEFLSSCRQARVEVVALGGERTPDPELASRSTVPAGVVAGAFDYVSEGGPENLCRLVDFLGRAVLGADRPVKPPVPIGDVGVWEGRASKKCLPADAPLVAVVFYRAHLLAGNTDFVADLADAIEAEGGRALPVFAYSLRPDRAGRTPAFDLIADNGADVLVCTTLAAGGSSGRRSDMPGSAVGSLAGGSEWTWDTAAYQRLDVPVVQAICCSIPRAEWEEAEAIPPLDVAMQVALPEFDGRIVTVPFAFKEVVDRSDDLGEVLTAYRTDPERCRAVARIALSHARLRRPSRRRRKVAVVLCAYPTKRSRIGNAVGLDTPRSLVELLRALAGAGARISEIPDDPDELMHRLAAGLTYEEPGLRPEQVASSVGRMSADSYEKWFRGLPAPLQESVEKQWGPPPGRVHVHEGALVFAGVDLGEVLVAVQPPRGFGGDEIATYHSPDLPPTHHYLAFYRWLETGWGAHAIVHLGKHGTLEWLPGKGVGLSAACAPDAALGSLPLVYPFVVNDPGEGTQAKRRAHAVVIDHLPPPITRAELYDDLARLERLLDEYANAQVMDPAKVPLLRRQIWDVLVEVKIHRDLGLPEDDAERLDEHLLRIDGYLCELKDAQIRGGLHVLGRPPEGEELVDMILAICRLPQAGLPSLRQLVAEKHGLDPQTRAGADEVDRLGRSLLASLAEAGWRYDGPEPTLRWICEQLVPALRRTTDEISNLLAALEGRWVPPGPAGAPTRGAAHVLPTGRNFASVDPRTLPTAAAFEVGRALAEQVMERHRRETGRWPTNVGLVLWGTAAMRTGGDDVAEALALLGVRPRWDPTSGRVDGLEVIDLEELGRPRCDVTLRISGFFRDAFVDLVRLLDEAVAVVASLPEPPELNPLVSQEADPRIFGPPPGGYGSGILGVLEAGAWETEEDLATVYQEWGGWAYTREAFGRPAPDSFRRRFATIDVAVKNQDNREHDIFDSDDYLQDHGGMVATARALGGDPLAFFGDSSDPARPQVRTLAEEAARVVRTRVLNPKWIGGMMRHGYKGAFEMAATVDYMFGYDATAGIVDDWMYEEVTRRWLGDANVRSFLQKSNPWAMRAMAERLLEASSRGMWKASEDALRTLREAVLLAEQAEEST
ncbi:MAG: cobaltochelatase CobN [Acidimicrobiales bacterium]|nr:MAG: cobaltochelatase CobN [Acidimicrobiales bacterium]